MLSAVSSGLKLMAVARHMTSTKPGLLDLVRVEDVCLTVPRRPRLVAVGSLARFGWRAQHVVPSDDVLHYRRGARRAYRRVASLALRLVRMWFRVAGAALCSYW